jgi:hypothetical protein
MSRTSTPIRFFSLIKDEKGASQLLAVMTMGSVMLTIAFGILEKVRLISANQVRRSKISEMRTALDSAVKIASQIYHAEAGCDPMVLNDKLSQIATSGSLLNLTSNLGVVDTTNPCDQLAGPPTCRQIDIRVNSDVFRVGFGAVVSPPFRGGSPLLPGSAGLRPGAERGYSHDVQIEVFTSDGVNRIVQNATLINTCTILCSYTGASQSQGICLNRWDASHSLHRVPFAAVDGLFAGTQLPRVQVGAETHFFGSLKGGAFFVPTAQTAEVQDLIYLKNYLRSGETDGGFVPAAADMNLDGKVDELDLGLLEKFLRGYLSALPTRCRYPSTCGGNVSNPLTPGVD